MGKRLGVLAFVLVAVMLVGACGGGVSAIDDGVFAANREINIISREDGSGTRGAFIELIGLQVTGADGSVQDMTTSEAYIANGTSIVMGSVAGNAYSIGYVSLGSLNDTVRAVPINGVLPSIATVQDGSYPLFRAFNIAVPFEVSELVQEFIDFILSVEGQAVIEDFGYVPVDSNASAYARTPGLAGRIVVLGSTSIAPIMERLKEAYEAINPNITVEVQSTGSSAGINAVRQGTADIAMTSRELSEAELAEADSIAIAFDGVAVIVHNDNPVPTLSSEQVRQIFAGEIMRWSFLEQTPQ